MKSMTVPPLGRGLLLLALSGAALATAHAQTYPVKPVRMIVPFAPGGNTDIIARIVVPEMTRSLGQQIIIENRGGDINMAPTGDPYEALVTFAQPRKVDTVIVDGRILRRAGEFTALDHAEVLKEAAESAAALRARAKMT